MTEKGEEGGVERQEERQVMYGLGRSESRGCVHEGRGSYERKEGEVGISRKSKVEFTIDQTFGK